MFLRGPAMSTHETSFGSTFPSVAIPIPRTGHPTARRFSVDEYHRMVSSGVLTESDRVQLVNGWIIEMPPIGPEHSTSTSLAEAALLANLPSGWILRVQDPVTLPTGEPEPDLVIARGAIRDYSKRHPGPGDIGLVVEVADATLNFDRVEKAAEYAAAGIVEYWIINLVDRQAEVHRHPQTAQTGSEYRSREVLDESASVDLVLDGRQLAKVRVADLLP
jgi:Uma2 family endonuclease